MPAAEQYFKLPHITLHGAEQGAGPLVIYLHGITANWAVWRPILDLLEDRTRGVAVSQRGHGLSDKPETGYTGADFAGDALALIEHLEAGPAIIVGHSLGARNAVVAGAQRPDLVRGVLSVDFVPNTGRPELQVLADRVGGGDRDFASLDEIREYLQNRYKMMPADAVDRRAKHGYVPNDNGVYRPLAAGHAMAQTAQGLFEPYPSEYRDLAVPMIALRGEHSTLITREAFVDAAEIRPDVEHRTTPDVDHYIPEEAPGVIVDCVDELLDRG